MYDYKYNVGHHRKSIMCSESETGWAVGENRAAPSSLTRSQ